MRTLLTLAAAAAASLALVACGGGSDYSLPEPPPPPPPVTAVPDSAIVSAMAFVSFLNGQSFSDETGEALTLPAGDLATSETDDPLPV